MVRGRARRGAEHQERGLGDGGGRPFVARGHRFALTGTPVENRLAELWSIFEFANPGLLGPLEAFRREYAVPIERYGNDDAAERLRRIVGPFLLRRAEERPCHHSGLARRRTR